LAVENRDVVILGGVRTPIGKFGGTLRSVPVVELGTTVLKAAMQRVGIAPDSIDEVAFANNRQAGNGTNPARQVAVRAGLPIEVPAYTINMACGSSLQTAILATRSLRLGDSEIIGMGGMESMSTIPYLMRSDIRWSGVKAGNIVLEDGWNDGKIDPLCGLSMGETAEILARKYSISREEQDEYALESHRKTAKAWESGIFDRDVMPVTVPQKKGDPLVLERDEGYRTDTSMEKLSRLKPAFEEGGTVTAGNSSQMSDGAAAMIMTTRQRAEALGQTPRASIVSYAAVGVEPSEMGRGPNEAIPIALERAGMTLSDVDLFEINEAFAAQMLCNERILGWDRSKVNVHGGAIAIGHPTGATGARLLVMLMTALEERDGEIGLAALCMGGGQGAAIIIRREG
jgi:acetyl-CoA C-acetyltransferase